MINEVETTEMDILKKEKDDLDRNILTDQTEIDKMMKINAKYQENLQKQSQQEQNAIEMLNLQEEELKSLHDESKGLAQDLNQERKLISKDRNDNKLKLQALYNFDVEMQLITETIQKRQTQIEDMVNERDEFENKVELARVKIEKC